VGGEFVEPAEAGVTAGQGVQEARRRNAVEQRSTALSITSPSLACREAASPTPGGIWKRPSLTSGKARAMWLP